MADIFISYSKADRELAIKLAASLEAEGWTVWWDNGLQPADTYRDVIMRELMVARAVISIWTPNSIKSDWVRAEAGRAKAEGKLIPVKSSDVSYADIPLPFGEMHTENVTATDLIRAAVVALLAKPKLEPSTLWVTTKTLRLQLLTWAGIVGGAITLFTNLRGVLSLADWARWIVAHWQEWTHYFWTIALTWTGIHVPPSVSPVLSLLLFVTLILLGTALRTTNSITWKGFTIFFVLSIGYILGWMALAYLLQTYLRNEVALNLICIFFYSFVVPLLVMIALSKERESMQCLFMFLLLFMFYVVIVLVPLSSLSGTSDFDVAIGVVGVAIFIIGAFAIFSFGPIKAINKRLLFIALGTLILIVLNAISVLGLQRLLQAPNIAQ